LIMPLNDYKAVNGTYVGAAQLGTGFGIEGASCEQALHSLAPPTMRLHEK
jgi:hypothetical protein